MIYIDYIQEQSLSVSYWLKYLVALDKTMNGILDEKWMVIFQEFFCFHLNKEIQMKKMRMLLTSKIRKELNCKGSVTPIEIINGFDAPHYVGQGWYYETPSGNIVHYPNAYKRKAKNNNACHYVRSDRRIEVGDEWLVENKIVDFDKITCTL